MTTHKNGAVQLYTIKERLINDLGYAERLRLTGARPA